jgi:hypothetical protein
MLWKLCIDKVIDHYRPSLEVNIAKMPDSKQESTQPVSKFYPGSGNSQRQFSCLLQLPDAVVAKVRDEHYKHGAVRRAGCK